MLRTLAPLRLENIATFKSALDLHVLSTPPAFVLSQNQTLQLKLGTPPKRYASKVAIFLKLNTLLVLLVSTSYRLKLLKSFSLLFSFQRASGITAKIALPSIRPLIRGQKI